MDTASSNTLSYISFENAHEQDESQFFQLPGEVRESIYHYALSSYEDTSRPYARNTYWFRPQYLAPQRCDTEFLRSCKRVYEESWYIPWTSMGHTFWLTSGERAPDGRMTREKFANALQMVKAHHGDVEIENVRFFAQQFMLEPGQALAHFLNHDCFHPKCITVTLRHTDWWFWESDEPLKCRAVWVNNCYFPSSVRRIKMELESLERKKDQIDSIAEQMKDAWHFQKQDGTHLTAKNTPVEVSRWKGSSSWDGQRWIRDETEPDTISYYVATVTWQREPDVTVNTTRRCRDLRNKARQYRVNSQPNTLSLLDLRMAQVPPSTSGDEARDMIARWSAETAAQAAELDARVHPETGELQG